MFIYSSVLLFVDSLLCANSISTSLMPSDSQYGLKKDERRHSGSKTKRERMAMTSLRRGHPRLVWKKE